MSRTAGQVVDAAVLGSIEFGALELGIPLIVVLGHEKCGAVQATIEALEHHADAQGSIGALVDGIRSAVEQAKDQEGDLPNNAVNTNIALVERLKQSPVLAAKTEKGTVKVVGGCYDLDAGTMESTAS